jgi:hypothetical protein
MFSADPAAKSQAAFLHFGDVPFSNRGCLTLRYGTHEHRASISAIQFFYTLPRKKKCVKSDSHKIGNFVQNIKSFREFPLFLWYSDGEELFSRHIV